MSQKLSVEERDDSLPELSMENYSLFREKYKEYALTCGSAGNIIITGIDEVMRIPRRNMRVMHMVPDPNNPGQDIEVENPAGALVYENTARGDSQFERYEKKYEELMNGKKKLMFKLLSKADTTVKSALTTSPGYQQLFDTFDIHGLWNLTEQVCLGRGAISVYAVIVRLLHLRQDGLYNTYEKDFKRMRADLMAQGTAIEVLERIFNALFILGLNQEQFKEKLTAIYGTRNWPNIDALSAELHIFAESTQRMMELRKDNNEGKILAHGVTADDTRPRRQCWNCGSYEHQKWKCDKPPKTCTRCGGSGHMEKFCRVSPTGDMKDMKMASRPVNQVERAGDSERGGRGRGRGGGGGRGSKPMKSNRANSRARLMKKVLAHLITAEEDDEEEEVRAENLEYGDEKDFITAEDDQYDDDVKYTAHPTTCFDVEENVAKKPSNLWVAALATGVSKKRYAIDSCCRGAHVVTSPDILAKRLDTANWSKMPTVEGIAPGHTLETTEVGTIAAIDGKALVTPDAGANLLSLMEIIKHNDGTFHGDRENFIVRDGANNVILHAKNVGDEFWSVGEEDLSQNVSAFVNGVEIPLIPEREGQLLDEPPLHTQEVGDDGHPLLNQERMIAEVHTHITAEERARAKEAFGLCKLLRHPGDEYLIQALKNGVFTSTHLTAQDLRNARTLYGPCQACREGKMVAPTEQQSLTEPARKIGDRVHTDLIILEGKSVGDNTVILLSVDEKTSYIVAVPCPGKGEKSIREAGLQTVSDFNSQGHVVRHMICDDENSLGVLRKHLGPLGIEVTSTPAGLHEKRVERTIRTIKEKRNAMLCGLWYELPPQLEAESYMDAITWLNRMPNSTTGSYSTPQMLFARDGRKTFVPRYHFGQIGLFYDKKDEANQRSIYGIFLGYGPTQNYLRCYNPLMKTVTSKRKFDPLRGCPAVWNLKTRFRSRKPRAQQTPQALPMPAPTPASNAPIQRLQQPSQQPAIATSAPTRSEGAATLHVPRSSTACDAISQTQAPTRHSEGDGHAASGARQQQQLRESATDMLFSNDASVEPPRSARQTHRPDPLLQLPKPKRWNDDVNAFVSKRSDTAEHIGTKPFSVLAMKTSLNAALQNKDRRQAILKAIDAEIDNLEQPGVLEPTRPQHIPTELRRHIINVYMFHKEKYKADGTFDKDKMRLVLLSNLRDPDTIGDSFSPTVNPISVMTQLNIAALKKGTVVAAYDIKGAFLLTPMQEGTRMFIRVGPDVAEHWIRRCPHRLKWVHDDGCLYFELKRYVYGLHEAPNQFNSYLDKILKESGFTPTRADPCLYTKSTRDGIIILSTHVDDMLLTCPHVKWRTWFESVCEKYFTLVKQYDNISYLGIQINQNTNTGHITLNQHGYLTSVLKKYGFDKLHKFPTLPAVESLVSSQPHAKSADKKKFLSLVMSLMYLARFTRPDIHFAVSYLATKCKSPTTVDQQHLERILRYLAGTPYEGLCFRSDIPFKPSISADASHHLYPEGHGQEGMVISNGSSPVAVRSAKMKLMTRSSAESELVTLENASTYAVWYVTLLEDLGMSNQRPITILQDNKSTIIMAIQGATFRRTKHLIGRQSYVRERIQNGDIQLQYQASATMVADIMTKPTPLATFQRLKKQLHMVTIGQSKIQQ